MPYDHTPFSQQIPTVLRPRGSWLLLLLIALALFASVAGATGKPVYAAQGTSTLAFVQAQQVTGVPAPLLEALCYMEGHLSNHAGHPSLDNGFGCMHLIKNNHGDTLDQAARELKVSVQQLQQDLSTNILGGARILRDDALQISPTHQLPSTLSEWYGAVVSYSHVTTHALALAYADAVYKLLNTGFRGQTDDGATVTVQAQQVRPDTSTLASVQQHKGDLPNGCSNDSNVDYPDAVDCIIDPTLYDCNVVQASYPHCTYEDANRPDDYAVNYVVIHDSEATLQEDLNTFLSPNSGVSIHYIVDVDGTVYQLLSDADIAYHTGNYWYNQHAIGIEHPGWDATGYRWYNAAQYLGSARLAAYLLQKFDIPLDHEHVISHATIPPEGLYTNHVDPGPYWLWTYYLALIHEQGIPYADDTDASDPHIFTLQPGADRQLLGRNGREAPANFNFFALYNGPSTRSGRIPQLTSPSVFIDASNNVETNMSYYALATARDQAGTGDTMYKIWYGEYDRAHSKHRSLLQTAHTAWLAVPPGAVVEGAGTAVQLTASDNGPVQIFGEPGGTTAIGVAPSGAIFISGYTAPDDDTGDIWYEIDYNHRQAWVPASSAATID